MKNIAMIGFMLLLGGNEALAQSVQKDQLTVSLSKPDMPATLDINSVYGEIVVKGYEGKEILIEASSAGSKSESSPQQEKGLKKLDKGNPLGLSAEEENNAVTVQTKSAFMPINLMVKVPWKTSLKLRTYDQGDILVENVVGNLEVNNVGGAIALVNIAGGVVASTYKGNLSVSLQKGDQNKPMAFSSVGGRIEIEYSADLKASMKVKSERGEVYSDIVMGKSSGATVKFSEAGKSKMSLDDWLYGKVNGGGPQIMVSNYLGDIHFGKSKPSAAISK